MALFNEDIENISSESRQLVELYTEFLEKKVSSYEQFEEVDKLIWILIKALINILTLAKMRFKWR